MIAALERFTGIIETEEFDITIEENQQFLQGLMTHFPNNEKILTTGLDVFIDALASLVNVNISQIRERQNHSEEDRENPRVLVFNLDAKFLEKFFYLFLVSVINNKTGNTSQ